MGNINTYLKWRGDLDFTERTFCEADNLALAILSYLDLGQIVSHDQKEISIQKAYEQYQALEIPHFTGDDSYRLMFQYMASSRRFRTAELSYYRTIFDESRSTQFAAVQIRLGDGSRYISFRGTDYSITGWEEDFRMGSEVVPAQREATKYLNEIMDPKGAYRIGGHSKGGNLAIYEMENGDGTVSLITMARDGKGNLYYRDGSEELWFLSQGSGYAQAMPDEDGVLTPISSGTILKEKAVRENAASFWKCVETSDKLIAPGFSYAGDATIAERTCDLYTNTM